MCTQVSLTILEDEPGARAHALGAFGCVDAAKCRDLAQKGGRRSGDANGFQADPVAQRREGSGSPLVAGEIGDLVEEDRREWVPGRRQRRCTVAALQRVQNRREFYGMALPARRRSKPSA